MLAEIVLEESNVQTRPRAFYWDAKAGRACGAWQLRCACLPGTLAGQARVALRLLHIGRARCPESPMAPYLGACRIGAGRHIADRRVAKARCALRLTIAPTCATVAPGGLIAWETSGE